MIATKKSRCMVWKWTMRGKMNMGRYPIGGLKQRQPDLGQFVPLQLVRGESRGRL
jgi:hypothetical protein